MSEPADNDAILVQRAQEGDKTAFVALYERYQPPVFTYVYYRVDDQALAEDLTAEVFVRMVAKIHTYHATSPLLAWLYTIARNLIADHYREASRVAPLHERTTMSPLDPTEEAHRRMREAELRAALKRLTEEQRQVVILKFIERRSNLQIATLLGKTEGAIKSLQHRALDTLRRLLDTQPRMS
ncbi:MAG: sigma-70 family RNA polymerase sigma factor [Anaerolineales bacterium]|nr:sigma-70 family RNA polymerase sigma factor [Anaerolineales bacterium]